MFKSKERIYAKGEVIGAYAVERLVAAGSTGMVYEARPEPSMRGDLVTRGIERVAVKVVRADLLLPDRRGRRRWWLRFDREFQTLKGLTLKGHPNVVPVYELGFDEGVPFYAMEWVQGPTLEVALQARPRLGQILYCYAQLCGAVTHLHHGGICHRDLKPSNVLLREESGSPVLIDFGLCQPPMERTLTWPHELLGTTGYVSPEYAAHWMDEDRTEAYVAAPTDDVWALGVILYDILTGGVPWQTNPERREALLREIQEVTPPHPTDVYPKVPRAVGDVAMKLLEKDVNRRPQNGHEVLALLGPAAEGEDVLSPIAPRRSPEWLRREMRLPAKPPSVGGKKPRRAKPRHPRGHAHNALLALIAVGFVIYVVGLVQGRGQAQQELRADAGTRNTLSKADAGTASTPLPNGPNPVIPQPPDGERAKKSPPWHPPMMIEKGLPLPNAPFRGQMKAPCPEPYTEMIGACWIEHRRFDSHGNPVTLCDKREVETNGKCYEPVKEPASEPSAVDGILHLEP